MKPALSRLLLIICKESILMQTISSKENRIIKEAASLFEKKYRDELGLFLLEGPNIVKEAMEEGGRVRFIFTLAGSSSEEVQEIAALAEEKNLAVYELSSEAFAKVTQTNSPQDIVAVMEKRQMTEDEFFKLVQNGNVVVLDRLQDPGNVGTIIRTAEALGFKGLAVIKGTADVYQPKVVRAAAGSMLRFPIIFFEDEDTLTAVFKNHGKKLYTTAMQAKSVYDADIKENSCIVIGNEGNGVSKKLLENSETLSIPMEGKTESLNAAISASIIMYESLRQRR